LNIKVQGKRGFLGIGKTSSQFDAVVVEDAVVEVTYVQPAKVVFTVGKSRPVSSKKEVASFAVMAFDETDGSISICGDNGDGVYRNLHLVKEPAMLFVPSETMQYLKRDQKLWARVKNPDKRSLPNSDIPAPEGGL